ncbi:MAG: sodium:alanine symporter family protein [Deltaproteobacteria bacterium]|nr:sodium:alanine symporter family protein [Deltaproteobacteria bacterium]
MTLLKTLETIDSFIWGLPLITLLVGTGLFLTIRLNFVQFLHWRHALDLIRGKYDNKNDEGDISHFQALSAALSATIGLGNIAGVALAITMGGPGAVFWMWVTALVGMATKYTSCTLAVKYRLTHKNGSISGGPMYFIEKGLGPRFKFLSVFFSFACIFAAFGMGNMFQANQVAKALFDGFHIPHYMTGIILAVLAYLVIIGGIKRIGQVASRLVPFMCLLYIVAAILILIIKIDVLVNSFLLIMTSAFTGTAAIGGFAGVAVSKTIVKGVARGIFSNEAGLGSSPIAHAAAKTKEPVREGLVAMAEPFIDTIIICSMTALVIVSTGVWTEAEGIAGIALTIKAFESVLPHFGGYIVIFSATLFAFSTMISWSYYGERSAEYILGEKAVYAFKMAYVFLIVVGAVYELTPIILFCDIANACMAIPTLFALVALSGIVKKLTQDYFERTFS